MRPPGAAGMVFERLLGRGRTPWTLLLDGRSGTGKSRLAQRLAAAVRTATGRAPVFVRMDDLYHGWFGLSSTAAEVAEQLLRPRRCGLPGRVRTWDWERGAPDRWRRIERDRPLILEGCGALTRASAPLADLRVWLEAPAELRRERALGRDGAVYEPYWEAWAAQEEELLRLDGPRRLADLVIDTTAPERPRLIASRT